SDAAGDRVGSLPIRSREDPCRLHPPFPVSGVPPAGRAARPHRRAEDERLGGARRGADREPARAACAARLAMDFPEGLAELHTHLGGSVASDILWSLAHEQGIALPVKDYWEFDRLVTVSDPRGVENLDALDGIYHWTELIQSSPLAVERSVHAAIGGAYRS